MESGNVVAEVSIFILFIHKYESCFLTTRQIQRVWVFQQKRKHANCTQRKKQIDFAVMKRQTAA